METLDEIKFGSRRKMSMENQLCVGWVRKKHPVRKSIWRDKSWKAHLDVILIFFSTTTHDVKKKTPSPHSVSCRTTEAQEVYFVRKALTLYHIKFLLAIRNLCSERKKQAFFLSVMYNVTMNSTTYFKEKINIMKIIYYICRCGRKLYPVTNPSRCPYCGRVTVLRKWGCIWAKISMLRHILMADGRLKEREIIMQRWELLRKKRQLTEVEKSLVIKNQS